MSNDLLNWHIEAGEPCGSFSDLYDISDFAGKILLKQTIQNISAKDLLLGALRQHRHNNSDECIAAYDYDEVNLIVDSLLNSIKVSKE